jgi:aminoglycoside phosphotransferase (APT) family kinase protein
VISLAPAVGDNPLVGNWWLPPLGQLHDGLRRWLKSRAGRAVDLVDASFTDGGFSSLNVMLALAGRNAAGQDVTGRYVARLVPQAAAYPMFPQTDLGFQKACMDTVRANTDVPAPEVVWHETDASWLGSPFLIMRRLRGRSWPTNPPYACSGWVYDVGPRRRAAMQEATIRVLAQLHRADESRVDLSFLHDPQLGSPGVDQYVGYARWYYDWAREGARYAIVEDSIDWLDQNRPAVPPVNVINWGDARPGNILYYRDKVSAVLDWEMAGLGPRETDLGFLVLFHRYFDHRARAAGRSGMPELFRAEDVAARYEAASGVRVGDLTWYQMLAAVRIAIHHVRQLTRAVAFNRIAPSEATNEKIGTRQLLVAFLSGHSAGD